MDDNFVAVFYNSAAVRTAIRYSDNHHGKIQTRDYEMSSDPDPLNTLSVGFQNFVFIIYIYYKIIHSTCYRSVVP